MKEKEFDEVMKKLKELRAKQPFREFKKMLEEEVARSKRLFREHRNIPYWRGYYQGMEDAFREALEKFKKKFEEVL